MIASQKCLFLTAAAKIYHLAMKPAVGGKPPSESRKTVPPPP